jgi:cytochrome b involved in lipid metabolism
VAAFIDKHPGGRQKILDMCGKEATAIFSAIHSNFAWNLLKDFYIGKVGAVQTSSSVKSTTSTNTTVGKSGMEDDENEFERD